MAEATGSSINRLLAILNSQKEKVPELSSVIRRLEFLQQRMGAPVSPEPSYVNQSVQNILEELANLSDRNIWRFTPTQAIVCRDFLSDMVQYIPAARQPKSISGLARLSKEYPLAIAAAGGALILGASLTLQPALLVGGLNLLGLSTTSPVSNSNSTEVQSILDDGPDRSGSRLSMDQSAVTGGVDVGYTAELAAATTLPVAGEGIVGKAMDNCDEKDADGNGSEHGSHTSRKNGKIDNERTMPKL